MNRIIVSLSFAMLMCSPVLANDTVKVKGYTKKDGTYVEPYERSRPNAYKWDNTDYKPSEEPYNPSYQHDTKHHGANWTTPNANRFSDDNPNNDYPQTQSYPQQRQVAPANRYEAPKQWEPRQPVVDVDEGAARLAEQIRKQRELSAQLEQQQELEEQLEQSRRESVRRELLQSIQDSQEQTNSYAPQPSYPTYQPYQAPTYEAPPTNRYNPYNNSLESAPAGDQLRYNPMNNSFHYADPNATLKYDAMSNTWDYQ